LKRPCKKAQRLDALGLLADAVARPQHIESAVLKLHTKAGGGWRPCRSGSWWRAAAAPPTARAATLLQSLKWQQRCGLHSGRLAGGRAGGGFTGGRKPRPSFESRLPCPERANLSAPVQREEEAPT